MRFERTLHPLLATAFFGAMNDNFLRASLVVLAAALVPADEAAVAALLAGGLMMLPFLLFSGLAGRLADRFEKARLIRWIKIAEIGIVSIACIGLWLQSITFLLAIIFVMGIHSTFYGPLKQGWLPERLPRDGLIRANSWLEAATFLAILIGTLGGGAVMILAGPVAVGAVSILIAGAGVAASLQLPAGRAAAPDLHIPRNPFDGNLRLVRDLVSDTTTWRAALLESWFWAAGAVYLSTLPVFLRAHLDAGEILVSITMAIFAAGIGIGSILIARLLQGKIDLWPSSLSATLMMLAGFGLYAGLWLLPAGGGVAALTSSVGGVLSATSVLLIAIAGGAFAVPLAATVQERARPEARAQILAGKSILTSAAIVGMTAIMGLLTFLGLPLREEFLIVSLGGLGAVAMTIRFFPAEALQGFVRLLLKLCLRVEITGAENLGHDGPVVYAPNHQSLLDGPLLFSLLGPGTAFAMTGSWAETPMMRRVARVVPILSIDHTRPMTAKTLAQKIKAGQSCVIFPEGRLTATGALMKVYPGAAWLLDQADVPVIPIHIEGLEFSRQSRAKPGYPRLWFPKVRISVGAAQRLTLDPELKGRKRRERAALMVGDILENQARIGFDRFETLPEALADAMTAFGKGRPAITDPTGSGLTHGRLHLAADALARHLATRFAPSENVGVLLPTAAGVPAVLIALWRIGVVPAMLNPTLGSGPMKSCLGTAGVRTVISSQAMITQARMEPLIADLEAAGIVVLRTEDIKASVTKRHKLAAALSLRFGRARKGDFLRGTARKSDPAVILFTSGTEGAPKGVVLSHGNLLANIAQLRARTDINAADCVFTALPVFHSFGLTGGLLLPLAVGARIVTYPTPLHYKVIPEMAYYHQPTVIFGTDSFLSGWGRRAHPYDFASLRTAIAGAEAVKASTRDLWSNRFGVRILEGYGATETAPVLALNTTIAARDGTVGRLLPGVEARLDPISGVPAEKLSVRGPNIMLGYIRPENPGVIEAPENGWYDTGDAVTLDPDGFITISGRIKRFAKIGGEMVSLAAVEALAGRCWPGIPAAAIALPDPRKGNRVILVIAPGPTSKVHDMAGLQAQGRQEGLAEIMLPSRVEILPKLPMLASGKPDYPALTRSFTEALVSAA